jgi:hypothetical protein
MALMSALVGHWIICHFHSLLGGHLITMKVPLLGRGTFQFLGKFLVSSSAFPNGNALPLGLYQTQDHFVAPLPQLRALRSGGSCRL